MRAWHIACSSTPLMLGKTILVCTNDRHVARSLTAHLRGAGNEVVVADDATAARDLIAARAIDLVVVDEAGAAADAGPHAVIDAAADVVPVVALVARELSAAVVDLVCARGVAHVLARGDDGAIAPRDVVTTVEKVLRGELFGLDKYLPGFGVEISELEVRGALDRDTAVECIGDHAEWLGAGREARRAVESVVDELVTNAVYDAPRDADGTARYAAVDRRTKVTLRPSEHVTVRWGGDGDVLVIAVSDPFGALEPARVRERLRACLSGGDAIEHKAGGAGLGLYTVLSHCARLAINVDRGVRTEVIATIDLRRRGHGARGATALHLFFDDSRARALDAGAAPTTIEVCESLRVELRERLAPSRRKTEVVALLQPKRAEAPAVRARGSSPPPQAEPIGADTARGLLHGAMDPDAAIGIALRFLAHHHHAAVAYAVEGDQLVARARSGRVRDWARLREVELPRTSTAAVAALATRGETTAFRPLRPADARLAMLATGDADATAHVLPLGVAGELRWVLYAAGPRADAPVSTELVDAVRRELEACLCRLDPEEPVIEISVS